jgi:hypothetical protein
MEITFAELAAEVRRLAAERPDYTYPNTINGCTYTTDTRNGITTPPCLFGQALLNLGASESVLEGEYNRIRVLMTTVGIFYGTTEGDWAAMVQAGQDDHARWADAVRDADEAIPGI